MVSGRYLPVILRTPRRGARGRFHRPARTARDGCACRCCCGSGRRNRTPESGRLPGGLVLPTRTSTPPHAATGAEGRPDAGLAPGADRGVLCDPHRVPGRPYGGHRLPRAGAAGRRPAAAARTPPGTRSTTLPPTALDHGIIIERAHRRLQAKLSYTNIGFALAPAEFTIAELRRVYATALGHDVDPTNLQRILTRRGMLEPTGTTGASQSGGWPAGRDAPVHRFANCG